MLVDAGRRIATILVGCAVLAGCQEPEDAAALRQQYAFAPAEEPQPPAQLAGHLDGSGWTSSAELDRAVSPSEWGVRVYLRPDRPVAYLSGIGSVSLGDRDRLTRPPRA